MRPCSGYARPGRRCEHNLNYWQFGDYLGIGAGAHGKLTDAANRRIVRTERVSHPHEYLTRAVTLRMKSRREVEGQDRSFEYMLNTLRLVEGFSLADFESRTGLEASAVAEILENARRKQLLEPFAPGQWRPTPFGLQFLNDLQAMFLA